MKCMGQTDKHIRRETLDYSQGNVKQSFKSAYKFSVYTNHLYTSRICLYEHETFYARKRKLHSS